MNRYYLNLDLLKHVRKVQILFNIYFVDQRKKLNIYVIILWENNLNGVF